MMEKVTDCSWEFFIVAGPTLPERISLIPPRGTRRRWRRVKIRSLEFHLPPMGFQYRKSLNFGPFRVNLSRSGLGYSVGGKGFRMGRSPRGRSYSTFTLPGTGVSYRKRGLGCLVLLAAAPACWLASRWLLL